jgi:hypothetical protein
MRSATMRPPSLRPVESAPALEIDRLATVSLLGRDRFIADTAVKIEQLQASDRLLSRDVSELTDKLAELQETVGQDHRWHILQQTEKRSREGKLDEVVRNFRNLKARLDRIEARSGGNYHAYNSFEAVSRKLGELDQSARAKPQRRGFGIWPFSVLLGVVIGVGIIFFGRL